MSEEFVYDVDIQLAENETIATEDIQFDVNEFENKRDLLKKTKIDRLK